MMTDPLIITRELHTTNPLPGGYVLQITDASDLGLKPGEFPKKVIYKDEEYEFVNRDEHGSHYYANKTTKNEVMICND